MKTHALASTTLTCSPSVSCHFTHCWVSCRQFLIVVAVTIYSILTCTRIPCRDSHCENGSFEVLSLHQPSSEASSKERTSVDFCLTRHKPSMPTQRRATKPPTPCMQKADKHPKISTRLESVWRRQRNKSSGARRDLDSVPPPSVSKLRSRKQLRGALETASALGSRVRHQESKADGGREKSERVCASTVHPKLFPD